MKVIIDFFSFVEIKTKIASLLPFLLGIVYAYSTNHTINVRSTAMFFIAMLLFDMTTTAVNNYMDTREAHIKGHFIRPVMVGIIFFMGLAAALLGVYLTYRHGLVVLFTGMVCFAAGIGYTFGPAPISKSPYGEAVSGIVMGFCIPFLVVFINSPVAEYIQCDFLNQYNLYLQINLLSIIRLGLATVPLICCIANVMLANNICDLEADAATRYTMPRHIGRKKALLLYAALYYAAYFAIAAACLVGIAPVWCLLALLTIIIVRKNIAIFRKKQSKSETFPLSIQNFILIIVPYIFCVGTGAVL